MPAPTVPSGAYLGGTSGDDTLTGSAGQDRIYGWGGRDTLNGGGGDDWLDGGHQDDVLDGGSGSDSLTGGTGADTFRFRRGEAHGDRILDFDAAAGDRLVFSGYAAGSVLVHDSGDLWYVVQGSGITLEETRIHGIVDPDAVSFVDPDWPAPAVPDGTYRGGTSGNDVLDGTAGADRIYGWGGRDTLNGDGGEDWLDGGHQDDVLDGGRGADSLTGGTGADLFVLNRGEADGDWIRDFDAAAGDRIEFRGFAAGTRLEHAFDDFWTIVHPGWTETIRITGEVTAESYSFEGGAAPFDPILFFAASGDDAGLELWGYDGTTVQRLSDIAPGGVAGDGYVLADDSYPRDLVWTGSGLLFEAGDGRSVRGLWHYDDATGGALPVTDPSTGRVLDPRSGFLTDDGGSFYFGTYDPGNGYRTWRYDTEASTVAEIPVGADVVGRPSHLDIYQLLAEYDGDLILTGINDDHNLTESLWRYDSDTGQTSLFHDLQEFVSSHRFVGDDLLVVSTREGSYYEPHHITAIDPVTGAAIPIDADPDIFGSYIDDVWVHAVDGDIAYMSFSRHDAATEGILVQYDSRTNSIIALTDDTIEVTRTPEVALLEDDLYFTAQGDAAGEQLWRRDGATGDVERLTDFLGASPTDRIGGIVTLGDDIIFAADDGVHGFELHRYDTSSGTTERLTDLAPGAADSRPRDFAVSGDDLYFIAQAGENAPPELWKLDGETGAITDLDPDDLLSIPHNLTPAADPVLIA